MLSFIGIMCFFTGFGLAVFLSLDSWADSLKINFPKQYKFISKLSTKEK